MDVKKWLSQYLEILNHLWRICEDLDRLDALIKSPKMDGLPRGSGGTSGVELQAALRLEAKKRYDRERFRLMEMQEQIEDAIWGLEDDAQREVVKCRYIGGMTWTEIADRMDKSVRTVQRIHGRALEVIRRERIHPRGD